MERSFESPPARFEQVEPERGGPIIYTFRGSVSKSSTRADVCARSPLSSGRVSRRPVGSRRAPPPACRLRRPRRGPGSGVARDAGSGGGQCEWRVPRACPRGGRASRPGSGAVRWPGEPPPTSRPLDRCGVSARAPRPRATDAEAKTQSTESTRLPFAFRVPRSEIPSTIPQSMYPHKPCPYGLFIAHHQLAHTCGAVCRR